MRGGRKYLLLFWLIVLIAPLLQSGFKVFKGGALKGAIIPVPDVEFTLKGWFDGSYQHGKEEYLNEHFGFRNDLVRLHNQINFSLFKIASVRDAVVGKEDYLFERKYIEEYYGRNFIGDSAIDRRIFMIQRIADTLNSLNKKLIVVMAPSKARFFPEYIPDSLRGPIVPGNYEKYAEGFSRTGIVTMDCNKYFANLRDTCSYPLFARYGIHWSLYGASFVRDSLLTLIGRVTNKSLPRWDKQFYVSPTPLDTDNDLGDAMNLIVKVKPGPLAYPTYTLPETVQPVPVRLISVGDSFYWTMTSLKIHEALVDDQFWYYNSEVWPPRFGANNNRLTYADLNIKDEIYNNEVFLLICSEINISNIGFSFVDDAYKLFYGQ